MLATGKSLIIIIVTEDGVFTGIVSYGLHIGMNHHEVITHVVTVLHIIIHIGQCQLADILGVLLACHIFVDRTARRCVADGFIRILIISGMSGSEEERERIPVFSYMKPLSAGNAITPVDLQALFGGVQLILESPVILIGGFCCSGEAQKVYSVLLQKVCCHSLRVQSSGKADIQVSAANQFFGNNVDCRTADITDTSCIKCLIDANRLDNIRTEEVERDILIFRIFRRNGKSVKGSRIIAVAQSTDENILHSILFGDSRHFGYSPFRIGNTFA